MHIDWHIGPIEVLQPAGMVQVQMPHYNHLDIFDVVACGSDLSVELLLRVVIDLSKYVVEGSTPDFRVVFAGARFEQDQTFLWMLDKYTYDYQFPSVGFWLWV